MDENEILFRYFLEAARTGRVKFTPDMALVVQSAASPRLLPEVSLRCSP
jgi:hypothetical protein